MLKPAGPTRQSLVTLLQERIQYNHCAFFGVCGGAMMSGATNCYGLPGLDLFDGLTVKYDCNVSASAVSVDKLQLQGWIASDNHRMRSGVGHDKRGSQRNKLHNRQKPGSVVEFC